MSIELKIHKQKNGRFKVLKWSKKLSKYISCPGTSTYSSKANANAGKELYLRKQDRDVFTRIRHRIMASPQFCKGVIDGS